MFTEEEQPIRKYQGDLINRKGKVNLGVSEHTVPSVRVSGDREGNQEQERRVKGKNQRADEGAKGQEQEGDEGKGQQRGGLRVIPSSMRPAENVERLRLHTYLRNQGVSFATRVKDSIRAGTEMSYLRCRLMLGARIATQRFLGIVVVELPYCFVYSSLMLGL